MSWSKRCWNSREGMQLWRMSWRTCMIGTLDWVSNLLRSKERDRNSLWHSRMPEHPTGLITWVAPHRLLLGTIPRRLSVIFQRFSEWLTYALTSAYRGCWPCAIWRMTCATKLEGSQKLSESSLVYNKFLQQLIRCRWCCNIWTYTHFLFLFPFSFSFAHCFCNICV